MTLTNLASILHTSTNVIVHLGGDDVELTTRILANHGMREVIEIGIVGEPPAAKEGETVEPGMTWLHVTLADRTVASLVAAPYCSCKA